MSTLATTRLNKPWLLKTLISAVVLIGFGIYGLYDATVAYPNRGGTWEATAKTWTGDAVPAGFGPLALDLRTAGARLLGGCCGTGPSDIQAIVTAVRP